MILTNNKFKPAALKFGNALVQDSDYMHAWSALEYTHMAQTIDPRCMLLIGHSGDGKTSILTRYQASCAVKKRHELSPQHVVLVTATSKLSVHNFASRVLRALGDPAPNTGTFASKEERLQCYKQKLGLELVIIDEFHDLLPKGYYDMRSGIVKFIKWLMVELKVSVIMSGLPLSEEILSIDEQIETRCNDIVEFTRFSMCNKEQTQRYASFIKSLMSEFPTSIKGLFSSDGSGLLRLLLATHGNKRRLKDLLIYAIQATPESDSTTQAILHDAWTHTVSRMIRNEAKALPFSSTLKQVKSSLVDLGLYA